MKNRKLLLTLLFTALSICYILPMLDINTMRFGVTRGDDYPFHVARILSLIQQLKGTGWSQFVASFGSHEIFYGANIFYPPLTSAYPIALLAILFRSFISGYYVYIVLLNVVTCWIAYFCSYYAIQRSTIEKNKVKLAETGALLFAVFYTFSHYRLLCIFERMALGEYTALTFYPLVFAGFYSVLFDNGRKRAWLVAGITLLAYTHLLSLLLVIAVLAILFLFALLKKRISKTVFFQLVQSAIVSLLLSLASLGPILLEMISFHIRSVHTYNLQMRAYNVSSILFESLINGLDYRSFGIVVLFILVFGVSVYFSVYADFIKKNPILKLSLGLALFFAIATSTFFPWHFFQETPINIMQFPFRLLSFLMLFATFFGAVLLAEWLLLTTDRAKTGVGLIIVGTIVMTAFAMSGFLTSKVRGPLLYSAEAIEQSERYQTSVNKDYFPKGLTKEQSNSIVDKLGYINGVEEVMPYTFSGNAAVISLEVDGEENQVDLPIIAYTGMIVKNQAGEVIAHEASTRNTIQVELNKGSYQLSISFVPTLPMKLCLLLSSAMAISLTVNYLIKKRRKHTEGA